jgi:hypothetical protein
MGVRPGFCVNRQLLSDATSPNDGLTAKPESLGSGSIIMKMKKPAFIKRGSGRHWVGAMLGKVAGSSLPW